MSKPNKTTHTAAAAAAAAKCARCKRMGSGLSNRGGWGVIYDLKGKGRLLCGACLRKVCR